MSRPTVVIEVTASDATCARDLNAGGIFVPTCTLGLTEHCDLVVRAGNRELTLVARVVFAAPTGGAGLELVDFGPELKHRLAELLAAAQAEADVTAQTIAAPEAEPLELLELAPEDPTDAQVQALASEGEGGEANDASAGDAGAGDEGAGDVSEGEADDAGDGSTGNPARRGLRDGKTVHERLRGLSLAEQIKAAHHSSDPTERMMLERIYGKTVWEALLRNPRLTAPEVARIARMGALPRPLIEVIVGNGAWLQVAEVRRALLTNPRLGTDQILRVLRLLPKHELKVASTATVYPHAVRDAAKRLMKDA